MRDPPCRNFYKRIPVPWPTVGQPSIALAKKGNADLALQVFMQDCYIWMSLNCRDFECSSKRKNFEPNKQTWIFEGL